MAQPCAPPNPTVFKMPFAILPSRKLNDRYPEGGGSDLNPFGDDSRYSIIVQIIFLQVFLWFITYLGSLLIKRIQTLLEEYQQAKKALLKDPQKKGKQWLEKKRFYQLTDVFLGFTTLVFTPNILSSVVKNIANRWTRALVTVMVPLTRLLGVVFMFFGGSYVSLLGVKWIMPKILPVFKQTFKMVAAGSSVDPPVFFIELVVYGFICRICFTWNPKDKNFLSSLTVFASGLYFLLKDTFYFRQAALQFWQTEVGAFFLKSQLGRVAILLGWTRVLVSLEEFPYSMYFYFFFICVFQVYNLALSATPNLF
uniref:Uncharacterized protein n=1 Tax=Johnson-sea-linkia profunda TaxID=575876 RepID=A0A386AXT7_9CHLO|nr:hypothetical protein [Johnson-sea-linkia profunda]